MGFSISWLAVKNKSARDILEFFGFAETDYKEEIPESELCAAMFPNGWFFIWFNKCESPYVKPEVLASLSVDCSVIACVIEEHVMYSRAEFWRNGAVTWKIAHDSQQGMYNLETFGSLPDDFVSIKSEVIANQELEGGENADVDLIFDIPLETAKRITGFKHDEDTQELKGVEYTVLIANKKQKADASGRKPWWRIW